MDDVGCTGLELFLTNCSHTTNHDCGHSEDAGVRCSLSKDYIIIVPVLSVMTYMYLNFLFL